MAYQMAAKAVTLNDLEGDLPVAGLFKCNPSNILTMCSRSLCVSGASCMNRETTGKIIVYATNAKSG